MFLLFFQAFCRWTDAIVWGVHAVPIFGDPCIYVLLKNKWYMKYFPTVQTQLSL